MLIVIVYLYACDNYSWAGVLIGVVEYHGGPIGGHYSGNRLYNVLSSQYYWEFCILDVTVWSKI